MVLSDSIAMAAQTLKQARHAVVFTGAGISVESGIPPFRGKGGLWNKYNPQLLEISYFRTHPKESWTVIKEIFYDFFGKAKPNAAHLGVAQLEKKGIVKAVITQNVDNLHQIAGSQRVYEFHGTSRTLSCMICHSPFEAVTVSLDSLPPRCPHCMGILKPDFVFFGEGIPKEVSFPSYYEAQVADVCLVIGASGEVMPACEIPFRAKENGARIIEINPESGHFTAAITDIFLQGKATEIMTQLMSFIESDTHTEVTDSAQSGGKI